MFFMMAITDGRKDLKFSQMIICDVRKVWAVSGLYDIYGTIAVFYSMLQMEPTLLCADELLQHDL